MAIVSKEEIKVVGRLNVSLYRLLKGECSVASLIEKWSRLSPEHTAIYFEDQKVSYSELNALANRVANHFRKLGAKKGDVVALYMENCPEYLATIAGLNKIGAAASLINTHLRHHTLVHALNICSPRWVIVGENLVEAFEEVEKEVPVNRDSMDESIEFLNQAIQESRVGDSQKKRAFRSLASLSKSWKLVAYPRYQSIVEKDIIPL